MDRNAPVDHPIHDLLRTRWSPRAFADRPVSDTDLRSLFEAARWAASSFNEQPWTFFVATRGQDEAYADLLASLNPWNRGWAEGAPVLILTVAKKAFEHNGKTNHHARHDIGLAVAQLTVEATSRGLVLHQMAGIEPDEARRRLEIPDTHEPVTAIALGYPGDPASLTDKLAAQEGGERKRRPLAEMVFTGRWGESSPFLS